MITNSLKGLNLYRLTFAKRPNGVEHIIYVTKSGVVFDVQPGLGRGFTVIPYYSSNAYIKYTYSHISDCFYFFGFDNTRDLLEYNPNNGSVKVYSCDSITSSYINTIIGTSTIANNPLNIYASTDGNIYFGNIKFRGVTGIVKFDVTAKAFTLSNPIPDVEFEHIHGLQYVAAIKITTGAFAGVYVRNYFYDSSYAEIRTTIASEIGTSGLTWTDANDIWVHYDDRAVGSSTRRIFTPIGAGETWKFIDIKSPSMWLNSQVSKTSSGDTAYAGTFIDQAAGAVSKSGWSIGTVENYTAETGYALPTYDPSIMYSIYRGVGRFAYAFNYLAAKTYFFTVAYRLDTGEVLYTDTFDKSATFLNNLAAPVITKCNFGGLFGFSSSDEFVMFLKNNAGQFGFFRPDNNTFQTYDLSTNPSGYVIRTVNWESLTDPDAPGMYIEYEGDNYTETEIAGEIAYVDSQVSCALIRDLEVRIDRDTFVADVTVRATMDKTKPNLVRSYVFRDLPVGVGQISQAIEISAGNYIVAGQVYSGTAAVEDLGGGSFNLKEYLTPGISPNGTLIFSATKVLIYGYLAASYIVDASDWNNIIYTKSTNTIPEITYIADRSDVILLAGIAVRVAGYRGQYFYFGYMNKTTYLQTALTNLPKSLDIRNTISLRTSVGLPLSAYSDAQVEAAIQAYMISQGLTRSQVVNLFLESCSFRSSGIETDGNKIYLGLTRQGTSALSGIRIESTPGSGIWYDESSYGLSTFYPKAAFLNVSDATTISDADFQFVEFQVSGLQGATGIGRIAVSTNYIAFLENDNAGQQGVIRIISKANFESAAGSTVATFDRTVNIGVGSTSTQFGFGDSVYFDLPSTYQSNSFLTIDDYIYVTIRSSSVTNAAIYQIDLATGTVVLFATISGLNSTNKSISYNSTTNKMLLSAAENIYIIDNVTGTAVPVALS